MRAAQDIPASIAHLARGDMNFQACRDPLSRLDNGRLLRQALIRTVADTLQGGRSMEATQIRRLRPELTHYMKRFNDCFARSDTRAYFPVYIEGQLSDLDANSCEPIALAAGVPPRNLQEFLFAYKWDEDLVRDPLRELVVTEHSAPHSIGIVVKTTDVKKRAQNAWLEALRLDGERRRHHVHDDRPRG